MKKFQQLYSLLEDTEDDAFSRGFDVYDQQYAKNFYFGVLGENSGQYAGTTIHVLNVANVRGVDITTYNYGQLGVNIGSGDINGNQFIEFFLKNNGPTIAGYWWVEYPDPNFVDDPGNKTYFVISNDIDELVQQTSKSFPAVKVIRILDTGDIPFSEIVDDFQRNSISGAVDDAQLLFPEFSPLAQYNNSPVLKEYLEVELQHIKNGVETVIVNANTTISRIYDTEMLWDDIMYMGDDEEEDDVEIELKRIFSPNTGYASVGRSGFIGEIENALYRIRSDDNIMKDVIHSALIENQPYYQEIDKRNNLYLVIK